MRVAVLTTSYPLTHDSSAGIFVARLVENMPSPVSAIVITPASAAQDASGGRPRSEAVRTFHYAPRRFQILAQQPGGIPVALRTHKWSYLLLPGFLVSMLIGCIRYARRANVIHANWAICGLIAGGMGKLLSIPVITTLRGDDVTRAQRSVVDRTLLSLCVRWSSAVVSVSYSIDALLRKLYPQHVDKFAVIENGIADSLLAVPAHRRAESGERRLRLITVASLIPRKGIDQILRALHRLPDCNRVQLTVVGDGVERTRLTNLRDSLGLAAQVRFIGSIKPSAVERELAQADVFVLASHSEGRPNSILEAMATALPIVASNIPGVDELVQHGKNGLLFETGAIDQLAQHIQTLLVSEALRVEFGKASREIIVHRRLLWRTTAERYLALYNTLYEKKRPCAG